MRDPPMVDVVLNMKNISTFAHGIGPNDKLATQFGFTQIAHLYGGLSVHPWYVRNDFLTYKPTVFEENKLYYDLRVDAIFTEFPEGTVTTFQ